jgi:hypothetical protein
MEAFAPEHQYPYTMLFFHQPSEGEHIVLFNSLDFQHQSPDPSWLH